jgi:hypothetical protein
MIISSDVIRIKLVAGRISEVDSVITRRCGNPRVSDDDNENGESWHRITIIGYFVYGNEITPR